MQRAEYSARVKAFPGRMNAWREAKVLADYLARRAQELPPGSETRRELEAALARARGKAGARPPR